MYPRDCDGHLLACKWTRKRHVTLYGNTQTTLHAPKSRKIVLPRSSPLDFTVGFVGGFNRPYDNLLCWHSPPPPLFFCYPAALVAAFLSVVSSGPARPQDAQGSSDEDVRGRGGGGGVRLARVGSEHGGIQLRGCGGTLPRGARLNAFSAACFLPTNGS